MPDEPVIPPPTEEDLACNLAALYFYHRDDAALRRVIRLCHAAHGERDLAIAMAQVQTEKLSAAEQRVAELSEANMELQSFHKVDDATIRKLESRCAKLENEIKQIQLEERETCAKIVEEWAGSNEQQAWNKESDAPCSAAEHYGAAAIGRHLAKKIRAHGGDHE